MPQITRRLEINRGEEAKVRGYLLDLGVQPEVGGVDGGQPGVTAGHGHQDGDQEGEQREAQGHGQWCGHRGG